MFIVWGLFIVIVIYNWVDIYQTILLLQTGLLYEANPWLEHLYVKFGVPGLIIPKLLLLVFMFVVLLKYQLKGGGKNLKTLTKKER